MQIHHILVTGLILIGLVAVTSSAQDRIKIELKNSTPAEQQTKAQLERLMKTYDLTKWVATRSIVIDEKTQIPHSHPVLTLNTRHAKDDELLVSTFVHEQMHWFVIEDDRDLEGARAELKKMFPDAPSGPPEGARDLNSTYLHLAVCYLEYRALRELMGELKAKQVLEFWATDHYRWIYRTVLERPRDIGEIMFKYRLIPGIEKPSETTAGAQTGRPCTPARHAKIPAIASMIYHTARTRLLANGWKPVQTIPSKDRMTNPNTSSGNGEVFWSRGYREIEFCSGTGVAACSLLFSDSSGNRLRVTTEGEEMTKPGRAYARVRSFEFICD